MGGLSNSQSWGAKALHESRRYGGLMGIHETCPGAGPTLIYQSTKQIPMDEDRKWFYRNLLIEVITSGKGKIISVSELNVIFEIKKRIN